MILLTNDDGINAPGLHTLYLALKDHYPLTIVAPSQEKSGSGASITIYDPVHYHEHPWPDDTPAYAVNGTPADCVKIGLSLLSKPPSLIISGANQDSNAGRTIFASGTVGAAITATLKNIPAIAFSFTHDIHDDHHIRTIVAHFFNTPPPPGTTININIPPAPIRGFKYTRQGSANWEETITTTQHPTKGHLAHLGGSFQNKKEHPESDVALLSQGYITATPIQIHDITDHDHLNEHRKHFEQLYNPASEEHPSEALP